VHVTIGTKSRHAGQCPKELRMGFEPLVFTHGDIFDSYYRIYKSIERMRSNVLPDFDMTESVPFFDFPRYLSECIYIVPSREKGTA
jgi:hypothetical protein